MGLMKRLGEIHGEKLKNKEVTFQSSNGGVIVHINQKDKKYKKKSAPTHIVKTHTRKTKTGKVVTVKQHQVKNKPTNFKPQLLKIKTSSIKRAETFGKNFKGRPFTSQIKSKYFLNEKIRIIKEVSTLYKDKDKDFIKKESNKIWDGLKLKHERLFDKYDIKMVAPKKKKVVKKAVEKKVVDTPLGKGIAKKIPKKKKVVKKKLTKSNYKFGYFGSGDVVDNTIKRINDLRKGDVLYNQNTSGDKNWGETLKRKGLKILKIKSVESGNVGFELWTPDKGKLTAKEFNMKNTKIINFIKGDKK